MDRRAFITSVSLPVTLALGCKEPAAASPRPAPEAATSGTPESSDRVRVLEAMRRATRFLVEKAAYRGGYVWAYLPDFSRSWGELEARRSMLWVQPPGTPTVGHLLLDAFHASGDPLYLRAVTETAHALIAAQRPSGGWNYVHDFAGQASLEQWYATVAKNAWRMEEFHRHPDSSTFDDACTAECTQLLLRLQLEPALAASPAAEAISAALGRALQLVRDSQYPSGGWPQRHPPEQDYTRFVTFNDDVIGENIRTLLLARAALGEPGMLGPLRAAMDCVAAMQQPMPQPGWGLQHDLEGRPAAARSYEPAALATHTTAANVALLISFHELTGDAKYTRRAAEALDWLDRVELRPEQAREYGGTHPTLIEVGSGDVLFAHRRGSNVVNGSYYVDKTFAPRLAHYSPVRQLDLEPLRARLASLRSTSRPLRPILPDRAGSVPPPRYFTLGERSLSDLCAGKSSVPTVSRDEALRVVSELDGEGRWLAPLPLVSNEYRGRGSTAPDAEGVYASTNVGDLSDTSPYAPADRPASYSTGGEAPLGISVGRFISNMGLLIAYLSRSV